MSLKGNTTLETSHGNNQKPQWHAKEVQGAWFPHAFIGPMASLMRKLEGSCDELPTSTEDAFHTMACVEAAYESSAQGTTPIESD